MTENNKLKLAEDFAELVRATLEAERQFYSKTPRSIKGVYTKPSSNNKAGEQINLFLTNRSVLNNRKHPFQKYIDTNQTYIDALDAFREKPIFIPVGDKIDEKDQALINMDVLLDLLLANAIIKWNTSQTKGIEYFVSYKKQYTETISKKAKKLLDAIDSAPDVLTQEINEDIILGIESLSLGYCGNTNSNGNKLFKEIELRQAYLNSFDDRYLPSKKHDASDREFLIRQIVSVYMQMFCVYKLAPLTSEVKADDAPSRCVHRCNHEALNQNDLNGKFWTASNDYIVHTDVLINLVLLIDNEFEIEEKSTILRRVKKQKESDVWMKEPVFRKSYLTS